jgi:hypothetical protein
MDAFLAKHVVFFDESNPSGGLRRSGLSIALKPQALVVHEKLWQGGAAPASSLLLDTGGSFKTASGDLVNYR